MNLRAPWWNHKGVLALLEGADWVKLNREELRLLQGDRGEPYVTAERFHKALGLTGLVFTLGADGAIAIVADQAPIDVAPANVGEVVDAVGAGDAFASAILLGLQLDWPIETTLQRAQRFASELVKRRGATITDRAFYRSFADYGRTASCPAAPVQIPACGTTARGSSKLLASHIRRHHT